MEAMRREITTEEIETFWRDGIVCLHEIIDPQLVLSMSELLLLLIGILYRFLSLDQ